MTVPLRIIRPNGTRDKLPNLLLLRSHPIFGWLFVLVDFLVNIGPFPLYINVKNYGLMKNKKIILWLDESRDPEGGPFEYSYRQMWVVGFIYHTFGNPYTEESTIK